MKKLTYFITTKIFLFILLFSSHLNAQNEFITTWRTSVGINEGKIITIPTRSDTFFYDYTIDWGDGTTNTHVHGDISHEYANYNVTYTVKISGTFPAIYFGKYRAPEGFSNPTLPNSPNRILASIEQWGNIQWRTFNDAFVYTSNLDLKAQDVPDLTNVTDLSFMFAHSGPSDGEGVPDFGTTANWNWNTQTITTMKAMFYNNQTFNSDIGAWDTSNVTDMSHMFREAYRFNKNINGWNTANVTNMSYMFSSNSFTQPLGNWNTSKVTDMSYMFERGFPSYNNGSINNWDTSNVENMSHMFYRNRDFNQDLNNWNTSKVTDMSYMFGGLTYPTSTLHLFNGDISNWDTSNVTDMRYMFTSTVFNRDITNWNTAKVTNMERMFFKASLFNQNIGGWNTGNVTNMAVMFADATSFNQNLQNWDTSKVTNMASMFDGATNFNGNLSFWDTSSVTNMSRMFNEASSFNQDLIKLGNFWNTHNVTNMEGMFRLSSFNGLINNWDTSSVTNMMGMFQANTAFNGNIGNWNVENVTNFQSMFSGYYSPSQPVRVTNFNQDISNWNPIRATSMYAMFSNSHFNQNIGSWNVSSVYNLTGMFSNNPNFNQDIGGWNTASLRFTSSMFKNATLFDQDLSSWDVSKLEDAREMFEGIALSPNNYDALLIGWDSQNLVNGNAINHPFFFKLGGGNSKYCSQAAADARAHMIASDEWRIIDGGRITEITWTGDVSSDWADAGNWTPCGPPSSGQNATIPSRPNKPVINNGNAFTVNDLFQTNLITINPGGGLTIEGDYLQQGLLKIKSDANASGSFILKGSYLNTTNTRYERYLTANQWHLISSPIIGQNIDNFVSNSPLAQGVANPNNRGLGIYNNNTPGWEYYQAGTAGSGDFTAGEGRITQITANTTVQFQGDVKTDDLTNYAITQGTGDRWNLVGNPYTSFISLNTNASTDMGTDNFLTVNANNLNPARVAVYLWDATNARYKIINQLNNASYLAPGQGFFVEAKNGGSAIDITENMQSHQTGNFFERTTNERPEITLSITDGNQSKETKIIYLEGLTTGLDPGYDAGVFSGDTSTFNIFTHLVTDSTGDNFAIQVLPNSEYQEMVIPVGIKVNAGTEITFSSESLHLPEGYQVYLEDRTNNIFTNLSEGDYKITLSENTNGIGQFYLRTSSSALGIETENTIENITIFNTKNNELKIMGLQNENASVELYTIQGKSIFRKAFSSNGNNSIQLPKLAKGVYLVRLKSSKGLKTKKIMIE